MKKTTIVSIFYKNFLRLLKKKDATNNESKKVFEDNEQTSRSLSSSMNSSNHLNNNSLDKKIDDSRNLFLSNMNLDFKHYDSKAIENTQTQNLVYQKTYKEEIIIKKINESVRVNEIMDPIFSNLMVDKKEYNRMKFENDKKELKLGSLTKNLLEIEQKENLEMMRKKIKLIKNKILEEKEKIILANFQTESLLFMLETRKSDLTIKKQPIIKELLLVPRVSEKTDIEIEDLNNKIKILNQIYVFL